MVGRWEAAFSSGEVVRASVVRITLHAVAAADHAVFHAAMLPYLRASRLNDARFTSEGLTAADADALVPGLLELLAKPRSKAEIEAYCGSSRMWWALRTFAPLVRAPTSAPWAFGPRPRYLAAEGAPAQPRRRRGRPGSARATLPGGVRPGLDGRHRYVHVPASAGRS